MGLDLRKTSFYFIIIALLNLLAYGPSFSDPPRSDQIVYLGNTAGQSDWYSLAVKNYAYNRTPQIYANTKDDSLFRPVVYFLLGSQRWAFGYKFLYWQIFSFILHLAVLWLFLRLLLKIHPGRGAFFLTALFSLIPANNDMISWHHINSYLVSIICLLVVLNKIWPLFCHDRISWPTVLLVTCVMSIASLTYEVCVPFSLVFALYIASRGFKIDPSTRLRNIGQGLFASLAAVLFAVFNHLDSISRGSKHFMTSAILFDPHYWISGLNQSIPASFWWIYTGAFATQIKIFPYQRTIILPYYAFAGAGPISFDLYGLVSVGISTGLLILYCFFLKKAFQAQHIKRGILPISLMVMMVITVSIGRLSYGEPYLKLAESSYTGYLFWLLILIAGYSIFPFSSLRGHEILRRAAWPLLTAAITLNFILTLDVNLRRSQRMDFQKALLAETQSLIAQHGARKNFSFNVSDSVKDHVYGDWIARTEDPSRLGYVYLQLLYPSQYTDENPQFTYTTDRTFKLNTNP